MTKGKRFNVVREVNHERVLDMYSAKGKFVQRVHWEHREDETLPVVEDQSSWTPQSEYLTVKAAMTVEPSLADQKIEDKWVKDLLPVWDKAILLDNLAVHDSQSSLLNWKSPGTYNPATYNDPAFTPYKGFLNVNVGTKHVRTNFIASTNGAGFLGQNDITVILGINTELDEVGMDIGESGGQLLKLYSRSTNKMLNCLNAALGANQTVSLFSKRYWGLSRGVSDHKEIYKNSAMATEVEASSGLPDYEMWLGGGSATSASTTNKCYSFFLVFKHLTESEIDGVVNACDNYLKNYGTNIRSFQTNTKFNLVEEGHSFFQASNASFLADYTENNMNVIRLFNPAIGGEPISGMAARAAVTDARLIIESSTYKNILAVYDGVNDMPNTAGVGTTAYNALKAYIQARLTAGWGKVFVYTMTPTTSSGRGATFEAERVIFNNLMRSDLSLLTGVYILDTDTVPNLTDCSNTTYFKVADALHPTAAGAQLMHGLFNAKMIELYG